jgi:hypothetical protein
MPEAVMEMFIAAALRESRPAPPRAAWRDLISTAHDHGVISLLARAAGRHGWPSELTALLRDRAAAEAVHGLLRLRELRPLVKAFAETNVPVLLIKGAHLESACYESPGLRPRIDTDLLIREQDRQAVRSLLRALGYTPALHVSGEVAFTQFHFVRHDDQRVLHPLDVHWKISNVRAFASRLDWSDLWGARSVVSGLTGGAFGPSLTHALMLACLHRVAHHGCSERLIWLYDIHVIAGRLEAEEFEEIAGLAVERGLLQVIASGLTAASLRFGTKLPPPLMARLQTAADADPEVQRFLQGPRRPIEVALSDFRHLRGFSARFAFLREHLFPSPDFIRARYGIPESAALPLLYAHRLATGARRWL